MDQDIQLLPSGKLILSTTVDDPLAELGNAFAKGTSLGLIALSSLERTSGLAPGLGFWRKFAWDYLTALCQSPTQLRESEWSPVPSPSANDLKARIQTAPPTQGMEYLTPDFLAEIWRGLDETISSETNQGADLDSWLRERNPLWKLVGRVTFHLAENTRSERYPFAFLATYTHRLSLQSNLQYLPLGKAVKEYSGQKDARVLKALLQPVQAAAERSSFVRELLESRKLFQALAWTPDEAFRFLQAIPDFEASGIIAKVPDWWKGGRPSRPKVTVNLDTEIPTLGGLQAMLSFRVGATLEGEPLSAADWEKILLSADGLVSIKGQWIEVDAEKLRQAMEHWKKVEFAAAENGIGFAEGMRMLAGFRQGDFDSPSTEAGSDDRDGWFFATAGDGLRALLEQIRSPDHPVAKIADENLKATLRPYQRDGVNWLCLMNQLGLGACLADDMGLGKTIQVLSVLLHLKSKRTTADRAFALLIVPASLVGNWASEIERFAPTLKAFTAHPSKSEVRGMGPYSWEDADLVITTYSMLLRIPAFFESTWQLLVIDEAQAIKNPASAQTGAVKAIQASHRIALTGTPIENKVTDLWSLFDFLNPGLLGTATTFKAAIHAMNEKGEGYAPLRNLTSPYLLRRLKTDKSVIADLPEKIGVTVHCSLAKGQAAIYQQNVSQLQDDLNARETAAIQRKGLVLTYLMRFKQICDHPGLLTGSGNFEPKHSGKFQRLGSIAEEIASRGEQMLVFTQFRELTSPLSEFLEGVFGRSGLVLHGGTRVVDRQGLVERFQSSGGPPFFVISLKAGGTGLNLTAASHVVHFDRWWNPAVENQATDRAFRIGQKRNVIVHKFVCKGTIEEKIDKLIATKKGLADSIISDQGTAPFLTEMSDEELIQFVSIDLFAALG